MSIKAAIFDMDGTLLDSMHAWIKIGERYLQTKGIVLNDNQKKIVGGMLLEEMSEYLINEFNFKISPKEIVSEINKMVEDEYFHRIQVKPGVVEFLEALRKNNVKMCVATATDRYMTEAALKRLDLLKYFEFIYTCGELHVDKSIPDIYDKALEVLGTKKEETYVFEDTYLPITTVVNAGYPLVAVADKWSAHRENDIKKIAKNFVNDLSTIDINTL
ncbi:MAG: HAD family phosphatase [Oscillospiraceae bacterium]|nr:HAD family phosphatase [Oscillospiraceae bacterium]